jgi:hypothetical protein
MLFDGIVVPKWGAEGQRRILDDRRLSRGGGTRRQRAADAAVTLDMRTKHRTVVQTADGERRKMKWRGKPIPTSGGDSAGQAGEDEARDQYSGTEARLTAIHEGDYHGRILDNMRSSVFSRDHQSLENHPFGSLQSLDIRSLRGRGLVRRVYQRQTHNATTTPRRRCLDIATFGYNSNPHFSSNTPHLAPGHSHRAVETEPTARRHPAHPQPSSARVTRTTHALPSCTNLRRDLGSSAL